MLTGKYAFDGRDVSAVRTAILVPNRRRCLRLSRWCRARSTRSWGGASADPGDRWQTAADVVGNCSTYDDLVGARAARPRQWRRRATRGSGLPPPCSWALLGIAVWKAGNRQLRSPGTVEPIASMAVLPIKNASGDPEQEYLADGMTEQLIADLAATARLRFIRVCPSCITSWRRSRCRRLPGNSRSTQSSGVRSSGPAIGSA